MSDTIRHDSKVGSYFIFQDAHRRSDIGDYIEVKFTGDFKSEDITICNKPVAIVTYDIELCFSAIHNGSNTLETTFTSCSKYVNRFLIFGNKLAPYIEPGIIIPMAVEYKRTLSWGWWWPTFNSQSVTSKLLR